MMSDYSLVNLHIHTLFSDGKRSTLEVFNGARDNGVTFSAITDHDTYESMSPNVLSSFSEHTGVVIPVENTPGILSWEHITMLRGVELTFMHRGRQKHMIGLGLRYPGQNELGRCAELKQIRYGRIISLAEEINRRDDGLYNGLRVDVEELKREVKNSVPSRYHLGYLIAKQFDGLTTRDVTSRYITRDLESYAIPTDKLPDLDGAINIIHSLGGVAILPHLGNNQGLPGMGDGLEEDILFMYERGLDGIEVQSGRGKHAKLNDQYKMMAQDLNTEQLKHRDRKLLISIGNDDHGMYDCCEHLIGLPIPMGFSSMITDIMDRMKTYRN